MKCKKCGCTDARACPGGCSWVIPNLCSRCLERILEDHEKRITALEKIVKPRNWTWQREIFQGFFRAVLGMTLFIDASMALVFAGTTASYIFIFLFASIFILGLMADRNV